MSISTSGASAETERRARLSLGTSSEAIYRMVGRTLKERGIQGGVLLDVGCGVGNLWEQLRGQFDQYIGADVVRYEGFPIDGRFCSVNLDSTSVDLPGGTARAVVAVETIEHLENPRAFARELVRLAMPGGWIVVTTPNQLSILSKLTLLTKNQFNAFQENSYPAHLTALLEIDLCRIASECGLTEVAVDYSRCGRIPGTGRHYPAMLSSRCPRSLSDNILLIGRKVTA